MKDTTKVDLTIGAVVLGAVAVALIPSIKVIRVERQKRRLIKADTEATIERIHKAEDIVTRKIKNGDYDPALQNYQRVFADFEFYQVTGEEF
jgi:hypothetical protein